MGSAQKHDLRFTSRVSDVDISALATALAGLYLYASGTTLNVDATTTGEASKVLALDASGVATAQAFQGASGTQATAGSYRTENNPAGGMLSGRGAGLYNVQAVTVDPSDQVIVGDGTRASAVLCSVQTGGHLGIVVNNVEVASIDATTFRWAASVATPTFAQGQASAGDGVTWLFRTQLGQTPGTNRSGNLDVDFGATVANISARLRLLKGAGGVFAEHYQGASGYTIATTGTGLFVNIANGMNFRANNGDLVFSANAGGSIYFDSQATNTFNWRGTGALTVRQDILTPAGTSTLTYAANTTAITETQANNTTNNATGATRTLSAQTCTGTTSTGGGLDLKSGGGTAADGACRVLTGSTVRINCNATGIGFFAAAPVAKPTVTGSRGGNAALTSFLTAIADLGLITDSTTA